MFRCHLNYGPHHGFYDCEAHMARERWRYGHMIQWCTFERLIELGVPVRDRVD